MLKEKAKKMLEEKEKMDEKGKSGIFTVKEEDNESEEIKTEKYLTSEESSSANSSSENEENDDDSSDSKSRRNSNKSGVTTFSKNQAKNNNKAAGPGIGGGIRLNINVGASNIEVAERFKKKDLEIQ
jgi:hypothetical protein